MDNIEQVYNKQSIEHCYNCDIDLYQSDCCYYINGHYYCEDCIELCRVMLD